MGPRFAIRGVVYEFRAFLRPALADGSSAAAAPRMESSSSAGGELRSSSSESAAAGAANVAAAADVIAGMGIGAVLPGVEQRVVAAQSPPRSREERMEDKEAKQALEELVGIRAKYADRLMKKKMSADARREQQGRFGDDHGLFVAPPSRSSNNKFEAVEGSAKMVRYLQERGVFQALVAPSSASEDLVSLDELLQNFRFDCTIKNTEDGLSENVVATICSTWKLPANQIMLVVSGDFSTDILNPAGTFKCCVTSAKDPAAAEEGIDSIAVETEENQAGVFKWFRRKFSGFQKVSPEPIPPKKNRFDAHYNVTDMVQLRSLFEELNGISYRPLLSGIN